MNEDVTATAHGASPALRAQEREYGEPLTAEQEALGEAYSDGYDAGYAAAMEAVALGREIVARLGSWEGVTIEQIDDGVSFSVIVSPKGCNQPRGLSAAEEPKG